jgi:hypothetical protein
MSTSNLEQAIPVHLLSSNEIVHKNLKNTTHISGAIKQCIPCNVITSIFIKPCYQ